MGQKRVSHSKQRKRVDGCFLVFLRRVGVLPFVKAKDWKKKSDLCHNAFTNLDTKPNDALSFPFFSFCHHHHSTTLTHLRLPIHSAENVVFINDEIVTLVQSRKQGAEQTRSQQSWATSHHSSKRSVVDK